MKRWWLTMRRTARISPLSSMLEPNLDTRVKHPSHALVRRRSRPEVTRRCRLLPFYLSDATLINSWNCGSCITGLSSGHIPRSLSLPFSTLVQDGTLLSASELESKFTTLLGKSTYAAAKDGEVSIVASCGSGMTAGVIWLALQQVGVEATVYDESWTGYAMRPESKIAKGEA